MILTALLTDDNSYIKTTHVDATQKMADRPSNEKKWEVICNIEVAQILLLKEQKTSIMQKAVWIKRLIEKTFFLSVKTCNLGGA